MSEQNTLPVKLGTNIDLLLFKDSATEIILQKGATGLVVALCAMVPESRSRKIRKATVTKYHGVAAC